MTALERNYDGNIIVSRHIRLKTYYTYCDSKLSKYSTDYISLGNYHL